SVAAQSSDDDLIIPPFTISSQPRPIPQTPLVSHHDRLDSSSSADSKPSKFSSSSTKLPQKPAARRASAAGKPVVDWSGTRASTLLTFGLFAGEGDGRGRYEAVGPMDPRTARYEDEKNYVELDMDEYAEGLRLGGGGKKGRRKSTSVMGAFFDQFYIGSPGRNLKLQRNRRTYERIVLVGLAVTLTVLLIVGGGTAKAGRLVEKTKVKLGPKNPLRSNIPLHSFRANLKEGHGYVTSFPYGGLTNQLIELFKLIHVARRLDRAAILTELKAVHSEGGDKPLSAFFDLDSFAYYSNVSIVRWQDVKIPDAVGTQPEVLSCWGWRDERALERYNVKTHFWPFPGQLQVPSSIETSITFPGIEVLASQDNTPWLMDFANRSFGSIENAPPFPDQQLMCFENLFYVPSVKFVAGQLDKSYTIEELRPDGPVWANVGRHLRFNSHVNHITDELLTALLGSRRKKFVAVHLRQGDFVTLGRASSAMDDVVETFSLGVKQVQAALQARRKRSKELPVLFATDSDDPVFIAKLSKLGWIYINHIEFATTARFGGWYSGVLDSAILSRAEGFVGTRQSTFSYVAARRVESWNGGVTTIVG
ncbi:hypothetical protein JCM5296_005236, partial [Sporobolomyces johnsonii]